MSSPTVLLHSTPDVLAETVSARLITTFADIQSTGRVPRWVLTGGSLADQIHRTIAASQARYAVDWSRVEFWWGDERFVPPDSDDRNERQARLALLDSVRTDPARVHPMPALTSPDADPDEAAERYADELRRASSQEDHAAVPLFDVVMLGVGPDGHVASLFPGRPALYDDRAVVAVRGSPKPPPVRLSMTMASLCTAREVWFVVSGADKSQAVRLALSGAGLVQIPAAGPEGRSRTLWLLDKAAAAGLPPGLSPISLR